MGPFANILVDFDATASAQPGLEVARRIARRCKSQLRAVDVTASVSARHRWHSGMDWCAAGSAVAAEVASSRLADALIGEVERFGHDLVIRSQARDLATRGDVNVQLFRRCPCPVWALGAAPPMRPKIVAAVNATDADPLTRALNMQAIDLALRLGGLEGGNVVVLQAWRPVAEKQLYVRTTRAEFDGTLCSAEERAARDLAELASSFGPRLDRARVELRRGRPEEVIPEFVVAEGVDIVVAGARGGTGVWHRLFGSTAERLLDTTRCSVIAVKADGLAAAA